MKWEPRFRPFRPFSCRILCAAPVFWEILFRLGVLCVVVVVADRFQCRIPDFFSIRMIQGCVGSFPNDEGLYTRFIGERVMSSVFALY